MPHIFVVEDKTNRKIRLTKERWKHIVNEHPELSVEEIKETLMNPLMIKSSKYDPKYVRWYYKFNKTKKRYIFVSVKYLNGEGFIITAHYMRKIK